MRVCKVLRARIHRHARTRTRGKTGTNSEGVLFVFDDDDGVDALVRVGVRDIERVRRGDRVRDVEDAARGRPRVHNDRGGQDSVFFHSPVVIIMPTEVLPHFLPLLFFFEKFKTYSSFQSVSHRKMWEDPHAQSEALLSASIL